MYNVMLIAKYVLNLRSMSNLKLNNILYLIQIKSLQVLNKPAFDDELYSRKFGPIVPKVYYHYAAYGAAEISLSNQEKDSDEFLFIDADMVSIIVDIVNRYADHHIWNLTAITCGEGMPYRKPIREYPRLREHNDETRIAKYKMKSCPILI